jgi:hypothetical protein
MFSLWNICSSTRSARIRSALRERQKGRKKTYSLPVADKLKRQLGLKNKDDFSVGWRERCYPLVIGRGILISHPECNFANKSVFAPVKANFPLLLDDHLFDDTATDTLSRTFLRDWTTRLHPA